MLTNVKSCFIYQLRLKRLRAGQPAIEHLRAVFFARLFDSLGEASPSAEMGESGHETRRNLMRLLDEVETGWPSDPVTQASTMRRQYALYPSARAAIEMILYDAAARRHEQPLYAYFGLKCPSGLSMSYPIVLDTLAGVEEHLNEARNFPALKLICAGNIEKTLTMLHKIRSSTDKPLRVNGHGCWSLEEAGILLRTLGQMNVQYFEQPLGRHKVEQTAQLRRQSPVPILLSEDVIGVMDLEHVAQACDGISIQLMRCGGFTEAIRLIRRSRKQGLKVALDSTLESSAGVTAAAHLASVVDYVDLGRNLLIENDPIDGMKVQEGKLCMPEGAGLGLTIRKEYQDLFH